MFQKVILRKKRNARSIKHVQIHAFGMPRPQHVRLLRREVEERDGGAVLALPGAHAYGGLALALRRDDPQALQELGLEDRALPAKRGELRHREGLKRSGHI